MVSSALCLGTKNDSGAEKQFRTLPHRPSHRPYPCCCFSLSWDCSHFFWPRREISFLACVRQCFASSLWSLSAHCGTDSLWFHGSGYVFYQPPVLHRACHH